ncbi:MAG: tRNA threonylcarbamoyladenosine dehydratase [Oscillospiraceae bacterium]|nr:tRNA threonylcarbamoyladenosine dehydratase [Oscillospiraceae bacterium]
MENWLSRTSALIGEDAMRKIKSAKIVLLGLGGVGGAVCEALVRSGAQNLMIIDADCVDITNLNRQIISTCDNVGQKKCYVAKSRMLSINPDVNITAVDEFILPENAEKIFGFNPTYVIDAIDTMTTKLYLAKECYARNIPLITCLGTGNRLNPLLFNIGDISKTSGCGCPVARVMRRELRKLEVPTLDVLYSTEIPRKTITSSENGRHSPASISFVPPACGYMIASYVINKIIE